MFTRKKNWHSWRAKRIKGDRVSMPLVYCGLFGVYARDLFLLSGENFFTTYLYLFTYMYTNIDEKVTEHDRT